MVAVSMRLFVMPTKPKFAYNKDSFAEIVFQRRSFFQNASSFSISLSNAAILAAKRKSAALKTMLENPAQWQSVQQLLMEGGSLKTQEPATLLGNTSGNVDKTAAWGAVMPGLTY